MNLNSMPSLNSIIKSLYEDGTLVEEKSDFSSILGDGWKQSWILEKKLIRINNQNDDVLFPLYSEGEIQKPVLISSNSPDVLAFYISYHYTNSNWGIYILRSGVLYLASILFSKGISFSKSISSARNFLIRHELTHFQTDFGITSLELAIRKPIFIPFREDQRMFNPMWNLIEEGLANRLARNTISPTKNILDEFLNSSPEGYRDWKIHNSKSEEKCWQNILSLKKFIHPKSDSSVIAFQSKINSKKFFQEVPIYEIYDSNPPKNGDNYLGPISEIEETEIFLKDLDRLAKGQPKYKKKWRVTREKLKAGNLIGAVHLEKLKGTRVPVYSVGIDGEVRGALIKNNHWIAIAADHHDPLYNRMIRKYG